jgi:hypothetical protein
MLVSDIVVESLPDRLREDRGLYSSCIAGAIGEAEYLAGLRRAGLSEVEVRERIVYDAAQLAALVSSELGDGQSGSCGCGGTTSGESTAADIASSIVGKVWSAKVYARKPIG